MSCSLPGKTVYSRPYSTCKTMEGLHYSRALRGSQGPICSMIPAQALQWQPSSILMVILITGQLGVHAGVGGGLGGECLEVARKTG